MASEHWDDKLDNRLNNWPTRRMAKYRQCNLCNYVTYHSFWKDDHCPVCNHRAGYQLTTREGLSLEDTQITNYRYTHRR